MALPAESVDVGKIKVVWRGTYAGGTAYEVDDITEYNNSLDTSAYICVADSTGNVPSDGSGNVDTDYWNLFSKGASAVAVGTYDGSVQYKSSSGFGATNVFVWRPDTSHLAIGRSDISGQPWSLGVEGTVNISDNMFISGITTLGVGTHQSRQYIKIPTNKTQYFASTAANSHLTVDISLGDTCVFATAAGATWLQNLTFSGSTINAELEEHQVLTYTCIAAKSSASHYATGIQVDGSTQSVLWQNNTTPSAGNASGYDVYRFQIYKTGSSSYIVFGNLN